MTAPKHTPTPWRYRDLGDTLAIYGPGNSMPHARVPRDRDSKADAAYIVRCVNAHEALVDALRMAHAALVSVCALTEDPYLRLAEVQARAALALAEKE